MPKRRDHRRLRAEGDEQWQRIGAAKDVKAGRQGFGYGIVMFLITWSVILTSAIILTEYSALDGTGGLVASFKAFAAQGIVQTIIAAIGIAALAGALLSAGDTFLIAATQSFVMDISKRSLFDANQEMEDAYRHRTLVHARQVVLGIACAGALLALSLSAFGFQVADLVFVIYGSTVALFPTIATALIARPNSDLRNLHFAATASVVSGIFAGWLYGIAVIGSGKSDTLALVMSIIKLLPGSPSAYNAPIIAVLTASVFFLLFSLSSMSRPAKRLA